MHNGDGELDDGDGTACDVSRRDAVVRNGVDGDGEGDYVTG